MTVIFLALIHRLRRVLVLEINVLYLRGNWKNPVPEPNAEDLKGEARADYHPTILAPAAKPRDDWKHALAAMILHTSP